MASQSVPGLVLKDFLTWLICITAFVALERKLCRRYPGIHTLCRMLFLGTVGIAVIPGVWTLAAARVQDPLLLAAVTHAFGVGVLAQTSIRSLLLVRWLTWPGSQFGLAVPSAPQIGALGERNLLFSLLALTQVLNLGARRYVGGNEGERQEGSRRLKKGSFRPIR